MGMWSAYGFANHLFSAAPKITFNVDANGEWDILFTDGRQQGAEMNHPVNSVRHHRLLEAFEIENIGENVGPRVDHWRLGCRMSLRMTLFLPYFWRRIFAKPVPNWPNPPTDVNEYVTNNKGTLRQRITN